MKDVQALEIPVQIGMEPVIPAGRVLVDALFGTGFGGAVAAEEPLGRLMTSCAAGRKVVLAVDVPSGMDALTGAVPNILSICENSKGNSSGMPYLFFASHAG